MLEPLFKFRQERRRWYTMNNTLVVGKAQVHYGTGLGVDWHSHEPR
jgi:hypothetical protein